MILSFLKRLRRKGKNVINQIVYNTKLLCIHMSLKNKIMTENQTLDTIIDHGCSVARFGDGEFNIILRGHGNSFQQADDELARELKAVLSSASDKLLVCIPHPLKRTRGYTKKTAQFWNDWVLSYGKQTSSLISSTAPRNYVFGDTQATRPYITWKEHTLAPQLFQRYKELWRGKDIIIVEGTHTRFGVGNDLLDTAKSVKRILCPAINAFRCRSRILDAVEFLHTNELVLLALGATATVLASDLSKSGIQAIDIGHLDIEYEWFLRNAVRKIPVPGKYVHEVPKGRDNYSECNDETYLSQIVISIAT